MPSSPSSCSEAGRPAATTTESFIGAELRHGVGVVDALGMAGRPLLVDLLELALSLPEVVPEHLALQLVLHDLPLLGGEHGRVEGWRLVLSFLRLGTSTTCFGLRHLARSWLADGRIGAGLLAPLVELLGFGRRGLLRLGGGVDLTLLVVLISWWHPQALSVVLHLGDDWSSSVPQLVPHIVSKVVDACIIPYLVDMAETSPCCRSILEVAEKVVDVVLLSGSPHPQVGPRVHQVLGQFVLDEVLIALVESLVETKLDRVDGQLWFFLWSHYFINDYSIRHAKC